MVAPEPRKKRTSLLRANVLDSVKVKPDDVEAAARRLALGPGRFNVQGGVLLFGVVSGLVGALFALSAALRHGQAERATPPPIAPAAVKAEGTVHWIDISELAP